MEVLGDMTSALMITSRTGNWDFVDNTLIPLRSLDRVDMDHETSGWVQSMRDQVDVSDLSPMTQEQAFDMAQKLYEKMDYSQLKKASYIDFKMDGLYRDFMAEGKNPAPGIMNRGYIKEAKGVQTEADALKVVEQHGDAQLGLYMNHVQYRSMQNDAAVAPPLLAELAKHAEAFGNTALASAVQNQTAQWEAHGNINLKPIADAIGAELKAVGPAQFNDNALAVANLGQSLGIDLGGPASAPVVEMNSTGVEGMNAYERFRERMWQQQDKENGLNQDESLGFSS
jgi:hypothetical protein